MAGVGVASAYTLYYLWTSTEWHFIDNVDLIFHEAGHTLFMFFGEFVYICMGSGFQVLLPLSIALYFWYKRQRISSAVCLMWTGMNLVNVAIYAGDAVRMQLPLLGGDGVMHDWHYILGTLHLLGNTDQIATVINTAGVLCIGFGIAYAWVSLLSNQSGSQIMPILYVDRKSEVVLNALRTASIFQKQGFVVAQKATPGERVETVLASGVRETTNTTDEHDWVVTNPSGEQYAMSERNFQSRYEPTAIKGSYRAKGFCRSIKNPFGQPIEITASWGELQAGDEHCMIADRCDANGDTMECEPYLIDHASFEETYRRVGTA